MNQIFDDDSALEQRKQNDYFFSEKTIQVKNINVFGAKSIEPQSTLGSFAPAEILTLFSFVLTLTVFCPLSKCPRHCERKELNTSLLTCTLVSK